MELKAYRLSTKERGLYLGFIDSAISNGMHAADAWLKGDAPGMNVSEGASLALVFAAKTIALNYNVMKREE